MDRLSRQPVEPPSTPWVFPDPSTAGPDDVVAVGADLEPGTILSAYRRGMFPMRLAGGPLAWWSPLHRGILPVDGVRVTRSLRRSIRRFDVTFDGAFGDVIAACADPKRAHGWIDDDIRHAYTKLHELGWAHSVEAWDEAGKLAGGLYGVAVGGAFFGESMFHQARDASKVALVAFVERFSLAGGELVDVQWATEHLASLGAIEIHRGEYLTRLAAAVARPMADMWPARAANSGQPGDERPGDAQ